MRPGLRSLNVAVAAAIVLGEALRQTGGFPQLHVGYTSPVAHVTRECGISRGSSPDEPQRPHADRHASDNCRRRLGAASDRGLLAGIAAGRTAAHGGYGPRRPSARSRASVLDALPHVERRRSRAWRSNGSSDDARRRWRRSGCSRWRSLRLRSWRTLYALWSLGRKATYCQASGLATGGIYRWTRNPQYATAIAAFCDARPCSRCLGCDAARGALVIVYALMASGGRTLARGALRPRPTSTTKPTCRASSILRHACSGAFSPRRDANRRRSRNSLADQADSAISAAYSAASRARKPPDWRLQSCA